MKLLVDAEGLNKLRTNLISDTDEFKDSFKMCIDSIDNINKGLGGELASKIKEVKLLTNDVLKEFDGVFKEYGDILKEVIKQKEIRENEAVLELRDSNKRFNETNKFNKKPQIVKGKDFKTKDLEELDFEETPVEKNNDKKESSLPPSKNKDISELAMMAMFAVGGATAFVAGRKNNENNEKTKNND